MPGHCKNVSVREVDFPLTPEGISEHIKSKKAYTRTENLILRNGDQWAVLWVKKKDGMDLFRPIIDYSILSLPRDTVFMVDESIDVLNASQMARIASRNKGKMVVVQGMFGHVSFVKHERDMDLRVLDVVPPSPSKMSVLVELALASYLSEMPIVPLYEEVDINDLARSAETKAVVFPCKASGLRSERETFFLDQTPDLPEDLTLIGCDLSRRIIQSLYKRDVKRISMCPRDLVPRDGNKRIVKCCRVREGYEIEGNLAVVPWGATVREVSEAIQALFKSD